MFINFLPSFGPWYYLQKQVKVAPGTRYGAFPLSDLMIYNDLKKFKINKGRPLLTASRLIRRSSANHSKHLLWRAIAPVRFSNDMHMRANRHGSLVGHDVGKERG
jgi:hypothetical protein